MIDRLTILLILLGFKLLAVELLDVGLVVSLVVGLVGRTGRIRFGRSAIQQIVLLFVDQVVMQIVADPMTGLGFLIQDLVKCFDFTRVAVRISILQLFFAVSFALPSFAFPGKQIGLPLFLDLLDLLFRDLDLLSQFNLFFGLQWRKKEGLDLVLIDLFCISF